MKKHCARCGQFLGPTKVHLHDPFCERFLGVGCWCKCKPAAASPVSDLALRLRAAHDEQVQSIPEEEAA